MTSSKSKRTSTTRHEHSKSTGVRQPVSKELTGRGFEDSGAEVGHAGEQGSQNARHTQADEENARRRHSDMEDEARRDRRGEPPENDLTRH